MAPVPRRTQAQRRESTIGALLSATIETLAERGYAGTTTAAICKRAGLYQGALFRHFDSRRAVIAAATERVCQLHLETLGAALSKVGAETDPVRTLVVTVRDATREPEHAAWHEVMVAARTDAELRAAVSPTLKAFEQSLLDAVGDLDGAIAPPTRAGTVMLSLMHMFDSEAVTVAIYDNPALEADRVEWVTEMLRAQLRG